MGNKSFVFRFDDVEVREREFRLIKAGKALAGGAPCCNIAVVVDDPAERVLHLVEGRGDLHQLPQLDSPAKETRRGNDEGKDHGGLAKEVTEPCQALLLSLYISELGFSGAL